MVWLMSDFDSVQADRNFKYFHVRKKVLITRPRCKKSNNIMVEFVEIEVVNIQFTEIGQVIIELYYNIELIERKTCI